ncbi:hypothetical protein N7495_002374 [Penicillium taxi]|uniref:uncharacterized protein n=1 Tax=Penicillium taxi TaxID=168475 RepID=UPI00254553A5|nr:uncharacterized protein N7495_002374 [Penicillium taxi]KAJ5901846.1 hypothetical protein N7495_002374 [Penicillium taxi]
MSEPTRIKKEDPMIPRPPLTLEDIIAGLQSLADLTSLQSCNAGRARNIAKIIELYQSGQRTIEDKIWVLGGESVSEEVAKASKKTYLYVCSIQKVLIQLP